MALSLRTSWERVHASYGRLSHGLRQGIYRTAPRAFPFASLRKLINATVWPELRAVGERRKPPELSWSWNPDVFAPLTSSFSSASPRPRAMQLVRVDPDNADGGEWTHGVNALLHDDNYWYFVQTYQGGVGRVGKIPLHIRLQDATDEDADTRSLSISLPSCNVVAQHAGAADMCRGHIYVPVESTRWLPGTIPGIPGQIWVVDTETLRVVDAMALEPPFDKAPWCAISPNQDLLYTSHPDPPEASFIRIYEFQPYDGGDRRDWPFRPKPLKLLAKLPLRTQDGAPFRAEDVQAAIVTPNNHLLLMCDTPVGSAVSGMHLFDLMTGQRRGHEPWPSSVISSRYVWPLSDYKLDEAECQQSGATVARRWRSGSAAWFVVRALCKLLSSARQRFAIPIPFTSRSKRSG